VHDAVHCPIFSGWERSAPDDGPVSESDDY
jgi:hypothetical protein